MRPCSAENSWRFSSAFDITRINASYTCDAPNRSTCKFLQIATLVAAHETWLLFQITDFFNGTSVLFYGFES